MAVGFVLGLAIGLLGGELVASCPAALNLLVAEASPGGVAFRVETDNGGVVARAWSARA